MQFTIVDDDVEVAPIYRCDCKDPQHTRPYENHGLAIEHLPTWIIGKTIQNPGDTEMHITSAARLRLALYTTITALRIDR